MEEWTPKDARFLSKFLESETGQKLKEKAKSLEPELDGKSIEEQALQASELKHHKVLVNMIKDSMAVTPEKKEKSNMIDMSGLDVKVI